ncbi:MAG: beta-galactosidase [Cytophagales bacterium]|nr:beta-galactosidase [Cytophagales bacterium]
MHKSVILPAFILFVSQIPSIAQQTERHYLSGVDSRRTVEWDFYCTDGRNSGKWTKIPVPSNWELQGFGTYNYGHDWKDKDLKLGREHGLYRHPFNVPGDWKDKSIKIVFDGAMTDTRVKINGKIAGELHQGGFNRFEYDITRLLKYGDANLLEVDVAKHSSDLSVNRAERQADFWIFGGIYRPVFLEVRPGRHMERIAVDARADGSINVLAVLNSNRIRGNAKVELYELNGDRVPGVLETGIDKGETEIWIKGRFDGVKSWNPEAPNLYDMKVSLLQGDEVIHTEARRIGFRTVELRKHDGFYVNGEKVVFKGVNRHSFWPETGRALSDENHKTDIRLMKEMNMNAVRMSHYCPDERFLDLCDSLGLFVLDELTGWQQGYDTIVGPKRVKELILKDENHPSVIIWDHGNEGGWDFANEKWFHHYDIQRRPVIYPWLHRNGVDTHHYNSFDFGINRFANGNDVFMPTEVLHGLYDGGLGAGLNDFWTRFRSNPRAAGGFLWVFCDEAVLRADQGEKVYDSDGNHAPDGILGPHREREGSFYTIKEIWSPVQVEPVVINPGWNGTLGITNDYIYTNLNTCSFTWKALKSSIPGQKQLKTLASGSFQGPDIAPGETRKIALEIPKSFQRADIFTFTAIDKNGMELNIWSWPVQHPHTIVQNIIRQNEREDREINATENAQNVIVKVHDLEFGFDMGSGILTHVNRSGREISFNGGPVPAGQTSTVETGKWRFDEDNNFIVEFTADNYPEDFRWKLYKNGLLEFEAAPNRKPVKNIDFLGISFNYPEEKVKSMQWLGKGPYRVWKNRIRGSNFGVWEKDYNNTITGESFDNLVYPEFKGYHAHVNWIRFETLEGPFAVMIETPNLYVHTFTPAAPKAVAGGTMPPFPEGDISFLYEIPAMGTKFKQATELGPSGQKGLDRHHRGDDNDPIRLWFDFTSE